MVLKTSNIFSISTEKWNFQKSVVTEIKKTECKNGIADGY